MGLGIDLWLFGIVVDQWIVGGVVQFFVDYLCDLGQIVVCGVMDLWYGVQVYWILCVDDVVVIFGFGNGGVDVGCCVVQFLGLVQGYVFGVEDVVLMVQNVLIEFCCCIGLVQKLDGFGMGDVGKFGGVGCVVYKVQVFFGVQDQWCLVYVVQGFGGGDVVVIIYYFVCVDQYKVDGCGMGDIVD